MPFRNNVGISKILTFKFCAAIPNMDPWNCQLRVTISENKQIITKFEDNFQPSLDKLPDSQQYLANLEEKLRKIKSDQNLLKQLVDKREACMHELLLSNNHTVDEEDDYEYNSLNNLEILRSIVPQQALNRVEVLELLKHDHLDK